MMATWNGVLALPTYVKGKGPVIKDDTKARVVATTPWKNVMMRQFHSGEW